MKPLPPPNDAVDRSDAIEVLRGWLVGGDLQVTLAFEAFGNAPAIWGQLLAETAHHLADAMAIEGYGDRSQIFATLHESLLQHLEAPEPGLQGTVTPPMQ